MRKKELLKRLREYHHANGGMVSERDNETLLAAIHALTYEPGANVDKALQADAVIVPEMRADLSEKANPMAWLLLDYFRAGVDKAVKDNGGISLCDLSLGCSLIVAETIGNVADSMGWKEGDVRRLQLFESLGYLV